MATVMEVDWEASPQPQSDLDEKKRPSSAGFEKRRISKLLGTNLDVELVSYVGDFAPEFAAKLGENPSLDIAVLKDPLRAASIFPSFAGTPLDAFYLENVVLTRLNFSLPGGYGTGLHLDADLKISQDCGDLHNVLANVLGVQDPALHLYGSLGFERDWWQALDISSFTLEGVFREINVPTPLDEVKLTSLGTRVIGYQTMSYNKEGALIIGTDYGYALFGSLNIQALSWKSGIPLTFEITKSVSHVTLSAEAYVDWEDAFDVKGLVLQNIGVGAQIATDKSLSAAAFEIHATLELAGVVASLSGAFSLNGKFSIAIEIQNLSWQAISDIYFQFFGDKLNAPDVDFELERGTLVVSDEGFLVNVEHLSIADFPPANGTLQMSTTGISAGVSIDGSITIDDFTITNPMVHISCFKVNGSFKSDVIVAGTFSWESFVFKISLNLYTSPEPGDNSLEYTLCGEFMLEDPTAGLRFDKLVPALKDLPSLGGITLDGAAVIIASRDVAPNLVPPALPVAYPIRQGFFVCAVIGHLEVVSSLMGGKHPQLSLAAGWSKEIGFILAIRADDMAIDLGGGVKTEPAELKVVFGNRPALHVSCGVKVPLSGQGEDLLFLLDCALEPAGGCLTLTGSMVGMWENPFGLSTKLRIGNMILSASILLVGTPSGFGIAGDLEFGHTKISAKIFIDKDPKKMFIHFVVKELGVKEIVQVAQALIGYSIPEPPDVIRFNHVELYACPAGAIINGKVYPRGFCFHAILTILGKTATVKVVIGSGGLEIEGTVDEFTLGPLCVTGTKEPKAQIKATLTAAKQSGMIDGVIEVAGARAEIYAAFELRPSFTFRFHFLLKLGGLFLLRVDAGPESIMDTKSANISSQRYILDAEFQQEILSHLRTQIREKLGEAAAAVEREARALQQSIQREKEAFQAGVRQLSEGISNWSNGNYVSDWKRQEYMRELQDVVKENIRLNPGEVSEHLAILFQKQAETLREAKDHYDDFNSQLDQAARQAEEELKRIPVMPDFLAEFAGKVVRRVAPHAIEPIRRGFKESEVRYLQEQVTMTRILMEIIPYDLKRSLERPLQDLERTLHRERYNDAIDDILEEVNDLFKDIVGAITLCILSIASEVGGLLYDAASTAVRVASEATQATLKFASGALTRLLSLLDIQSVKLKGSLGGPAGDSGLSFSASVRGLLNGEPFEYSLTLHISDFWSFIQALFKMLFDWMKAKIRGD